RTLALREPRAGLDHPIAALALHELGAAEVALLVEELRLRAVSGRAAAAAGSGRDVLAVGVARAGGEWAEAPLALHEVPFPALRALLACRGFRRLLLAAHVLALGIARAADELAVLALPGLQR